MEDAPRLRCGMQLEYMQFYPMKSEWQTLETLEDFLPKLQNGVMYGFFSDNAKSKLSTAAVKHIECIHCVDAQSEPHYQHQNPAECKMSNALETTSYIMLDVQPCTHCSDECAYHQLPLGYSQIFHHSQRYRYFLMDTVSFLGGSQIKEVKEC